MADATRDPLDHPMYRVAHLHGDRWVTLRPSQQHAPSDHGTDRTWDEGVAYECPECQEIVMVAPASEAA